MLKMMLVKLVERMGKNWDKLLGAVLLAYRTNPHSISTGETPFFLLYGCHCRIPTGMDFYAPVMKHPTVESVYGRELFRELKQVREIARRNISRAQFGQKVQYDKSASEVKISEADLVMLKVEPRFKIDHTFRGPYHVTGVTSTCATIVPINTPDGEVINVSLQRLSRCKGERLSTAQPWMGHGRMHKRRQLRRNKKPQVDQKQGSKTGNVSANLSLGTTTRSGRQVKKPRRHCWRLNSFPEDSRGGKL